MIRHYDDFNATAGTSLGAKAWWTLQAGTWVERGGYVAQESSFNVDSVAQHDTDANLGTTRDFSVACSVYVEVGAKYAGVYCIGAATANFTDKVIFRWREDFGQRWELIVPGVADLIITAPNVWNYTTPTIHTLELKAVYQQTIAGKPVYIFEGRADGALVLTSPPRQMTHFSSSTFHVGMVARRETFGAPNPAVRFHHFASEDFRSSNHEPEPRVTTDAVRTPISIATETPNGSPATFPFKIRQARVIHRRSTRKSAADAGWEWTSPRTTTVRRVFECTWIGGSSDRDTLAAFFASRKGRDDNFQADIRAEAIGTVDVVFGEPELQFTIVSRELYSCTFRLVEAL